MARILFVHDGDDQGAALARALADAGHRVLAARVEHAGVRFPLGTRPDLVVVHGARERSGDHVLRMLRAVGFDMLALVVRRAPVDAAADGRPPGDAAPRAYRVTVDGAFTAEGLSALVTTLAVPGPAAARSTDAAADETRPESAAPPSRTEDSTPAPTGPSPLRTRAGARR